MDFRKTFYILPNLFTLSSVMCGFASLALAAGPDGGDLYLAALAICFGVFFDTFDGRVARLTKTQTDLGRLENSVADDAPFISQLIGEFDNQDAVFCSNPNQDNDANLAEYIEA